MSCTNYFPLPQPLPARRPSRTAPAPTTTSATATPRSTPRTTAAPTTLTTRIRGDPIWHQVLSVFAISACGESRFWSLHHQSLHRNSGRECCINTRLINAICCIFEFCNENYSLTLGAHLCNQEWLRIFLIMISAWICHSSSIDCRLSSSWYSPYSILIGN